ncbi:YjzD family protein [Staphylococcus aureus]|uniref:YjzD family protein n=1 Tax=Staphylococcus aureus TaxID=1280 RepID=UPI0037DB4BC6|nr:YjzD family protein [Staphylococcus aureus]
MKHLVTFFWALLLMQMVNFVLNSLVGGDGLNVVNPIIMAVLFTIFTAIFAAVIKPPKDSSQ